MSTDGPGNPYGAIGYYYQILSSLVHLADAVKKTDLSAAVEIENLDDFQVEYDASTCVYQTKHHKEGSISNRSTDLWRTFAGWAKLEASNSLELNTRLFLITTANASDGSIAAKLREADRSKATNDEILGRLNAETDSVTTTLEPHFKSFNALSDNQKRALVARIQMADGAEKIPDLEARLDGVNRLHVSQQHLVAFRARIIEWFLGQAMTKLADGVPCKFDGANLAEFINSLSQQFRDDDLPIDFADDVSVEVPEGRQFVLAMEKLSVPPRRLLRNAKSWWLSREQRTRWLRDGLVQDAELKSYDETLANGWAVRADQTITRCSKPILPDQAVNGGLDLLDWAETDSSLPIRRSVNSTWIQHGSLHQLADRRRVAWHLDDAEEVLEEHA